jgi:hypothetical protein
VCIPLPPMLAISNGAWEAKLKRNLKNNGKRTRIVCHKTGTNGGLL